VLLAGQPAGLIVLPLMLFHQIQLMACAAMARRYATRGEPRNQATAVPASSIPAR
jgi:sodium/bile acid cotransporter 7